MVDAAGYVLPIRNQPDEAGREQRSRRPQVECNQKDERGGLLTATSRMRGGKRTGTLLIPIYRHSLNQVYLLNQSVVVDIKTEKTSRTRA